MSAEYLNLILGHQVGRAAPGARPSSTAVELRPRRGRRGSTATCCIEVEPGDGAGDGAGDGGAGDGAGDLIKNRKKRGFHGILMDFWDDLG